MQESAPPFTLDDPAWLAHRYEREQDRLLFRHVPRAMHAAGPFLTDELVGEQPQHIAARASVAGPAKAMAGPVHFLFHSAFCGSTLLARALDHDGVAMALSEPVLLNDSVGIRRRGEMSGPEIARLIDESLYLLARPWPHGEAVVIKPSNILNGLAPAILALKPEARAILLHAPLRQFLSSVARKGLWCRLWVRELLEGLLREGAVDLGFGPQDYFRLTDLQVAAVGWLAQHAMFHRLIGQLGGTRVRSLDAETLMARPAEVLLACGAFYRLPITPSLAAEMAEGPAFNRHSKSGAAYSQADRKSERERAEAAHGDEIDKVEQWARAVANNAGIALILPEPLIG